MIDNDGEYFIESTMINRLFWMINFNASTKLIVAPLIYF